MAWWGSRPDRIMQRLEAVRAARRAQGHELSALQEGIVTVVARYDAPHSPELTERVAAIQQAVADCGRWHEQDEWRISTWFDSEIVRGENGRYTASVRCDGQSFSCESPSIERAFAFLGLYRQLVIDGFYSVGPPWADVSAGQ